MIDWAKVWKSTGIYAILAGIISFAVILITDQITGVVSDRVPGSPSVSAAYGVVIAIAVVATCMFSIVVRGTGNEQLLFIAIGAVGVIWVSFWLNDTTPTSWWFVPFVTVSAYVGSGITGTKALWNSIDENSSPAHVYNG